jgi:hypothetical protein
MLCLQSLAKGIPERTVRRDTSQVYSVMFDFFELPVPLRLRTWSRGTGALVTLLPLVLLTRAAVFASLGTAFGLFSILWVKQTLNTSLICRKARAEISQDLHALDSALKQSRGSGPHPFECARLRGQSFIFGALYPSFKSGQTWDTNIFFFWRLLGSFIVKHIVKHIVKDTRYPTAFCETHRGSGLPAWVQHRVWTTTRCLRTQGGEPS